MDQSQINGGCKDIALQLFDLRKKIQVILGGGRAHMVPRGFRPEGGRRYGVRRDGKNLIEMWKDDMEPRKGR